MEYGFINEEECRLLEADGILLLSPRGGMRKISGAFLSDPSQSSIPTSSSIASVSYHCVGVQEDVDIPFELESAATLEIIGLMPEPAAEIYNRWASRPNPNNNPDELLDYVEAHVAQLNMSSWQNYLDAQVLARLGIARWLRDAILHPAHVDVYHTERLQFWLTESLRANSRAVERLHDIMKAYVDAHARGMKAQARAGLSDVWPPAAAASCISNYTLDGHTVFYKAHCPDDNAARPFIDLDGSVNLAAIARSSYGDFNPEGSAWYWTPELATAEQYKDYATLRMPQSQHWIIAIQVPNRFIAQLKTKELWYSAKWKEYIWHCRRGSIPSDLPTQFANFVPGEAPTEVIFGHICKAAVTNILWLSKKEALSRMRQDSLLMSGNLGARQWVVIRREVAERLEIEVRGKMHIAVFASGRPE